jgi:hypothetical protein
MESEKNFEEDLKQKKEDLAEVFEDDKVGNIVGDIFYKSCKNLFDFGANLIKNLNLELGSIEGQKKKK